MRPHWEALMARCPEVEANRVEMVKATGVLLHSQLIFEAKAQPLLSFLGGYWR